MDSQGFTWLGVVFGGYLGGSWVLVDKLGLTLTSQKV